jgi:hypothetical protein
MNAAVLHLTVQAHADSAKGSTALRAIDQTFLD